MKKVLLFICLTFSLVINGCSCNKFDISTYESAVENFKDSRRYSFELTVTKEIKDQPYYTKDVYENMYMFTTTGAVNNFSSVLKSYKITNPTSTSPSGNYELFSTVSRYYVGVENNFYTKVKEGVAPEIKNKRYISYEENFADSKNIFNINNIVPLFEAESLNNFKISGSKNKKGYSEATFTAPIANFVESEAETATYSLIINKDFYFKTIKFVVVTETVKLTYEYNFKAYNNTVNIEFPADLINY